MKTQILKATLLAFITYQKFIEDFWYLILIRFRKYTK